MFKFILIAALIPAMALATNVGKCDGKPFPNAVRVAGCDFMPCNVVRGSNAIMDLDFTVGGNFLLYLLKLIFKFYFFQINKIVAYALGQIVDYPLPDEINKVCNNLGTSQCPLDPTEEATWNFIFSIGYEYPLIELVIEVNLLDQSDNYVSCFKLDAQVVD